MKNIVIAFLFAMVIVSCKEDEKIPDVGHIKADITVQRFEEDFFALDTNNLDESLQRLHDKYGDFMQLFVFRILSGQPDIEIAKQDVKSFLATYKGVYDSSKLLVKDLDRQVQSLKRGLQFTKHYFPKYQLPDTLITFIGPIDGFFLLSDNTGSGSMKFGGIIGTGLQFYMGQQFAVYKEPRFLEEYPAYLSRRFSPEYIPVNSMKLVVDEIYPAQYTGRPLVEQMVEAGKRLYVLDQLLPELDDTLITGYTKPQLQAAYANESNIWGHLVNSNLLYNSEQVTVRDYMNDAPFTLPFGQGSPPFVGQFIGWQIVKKYMGKTNKSLEELLKTPAKQVFEVAKYKPTGD